jgi:hypothetical protein
MDPITQSEASIDLTLGAILASHVALDVLAGGELAAQTTAESVGTKTSDLIDLSKIFAAHGEENVAGDAGKSSIDVLVLDILANLWLPVVGRLRGEKMYKTD